MKQYSKKLFSLVVLCSTVALLQADCDNDNNNGVIPFIQFRSQGRNMARKLEGTTSYAVYQGDMDNNYGTFNMTLEYDQSFRNSKIAHCLFGNSLVSAPASTTTTNSCNNDCDNSCDSTLIISGLSTATRAATDWMAENFLLPTDFKSAISFSPKVQSVIFDFNLFVGLDRWVNGLYFRLYGPVVWNKANLRASENIINKGTAAGSYPQGYLEPLISVPNTALFQSALNFFGGCQLPKYNGQTTTIQPLKFAKFSECNLNNNNNNNDCDNDCGSSHHKTGFAELRGEFGWNYIQEKYRLMLNIQAAAPTGTRPNAEFLLPAYVGNGKHWELGGGLGGSWKMWGSEDGEKSFNFIVEADITHLFKAKQNMTFDLKGKPNSRYMLAEQLINQTVTGEQLDPNTPIFNVDGGVYMPVANFSTREVKVGFGVQGDVVAMFNYTHRNFSWDLGYNFWGMSCSEVSLDCNDDCDNNCDNDCDSLINPFPTNMALKGDASVFGYSADGSAFFGLGATENNATIFGGTNAGKTNPLANPGVDNAFPAVGNPETNLFIAGGTAAVPATIRINTSNPPVFVSVNDLDVEGAEQRGISNKVFTHFNYTWTNHEKWVPYFGVGFSAEFGSHSGNDDDNCSTSTTTSSNSCSSCKSCALTQWGVEVKGGVSFH